MLGANVGVCPTVEANYQAPVRAGAWWSAAKLATEGESESDLPTKKGRKRMSVWKSEVTEEMVSSLSDQEISLLVEALNEAVQEVCENWGMK